MFIPYAKQSIDTKDQEALVLAAKGEWITRGEKTAAFEEAVANYVGAKYALALNSGSSALNAATYAARLLPGDHFFTTPNSFIASTGCAVAMGVTPTFIDIDRSTGALDLNLLELNINASRSRGKDLLLPVHFAGIPIDMARLSRGIKNPKTVIIEDGAHAFGSLYPSGEKVGSCAYSDMTIFSFHPAKIITTGEGGVVTTNSEELFERLKLYRNNGISRCNLQPWEYDVLDVTGNYHMTDFQAALGLSQLKRLDTFINKRRCLVAEYRKLLSDIPHLQLFTDAFDQKTAFHLMVVQIDFEALNTTREHVMRSLFDKGIGTQLHYIPIYRHSVVEKIEGDISDYFPEMERYYQQALTLPLYPDLEVEDIHKIVETLQQVLTLHTQA